MTVDIEAVRKAAGSVPDPEVRRPIADLRLLDDVTVDGDRVTVYYHLTSPLCPSKFASRIGQEIRRRVEALSDVKVCEVILQDHYQRDRIYSLVNGAPPETHSPLR